MCDKVRFSSITIQRRRGGSLGRMDHLIMIPAALLTLALSSYGFIGEARLRISSHEPLPIRKDRLMRRSEFIW